MAALTSSTTKREVGALVDALLAPFAHSVFARKRLVGLLIVAAIATDSRPLALGLAALLGARVSMYLLGVAATGTGADQYAYNALLVGLMLAEDYTLSPRALRWLHCSLPAACS